MRESEFWPQDDSPRTLEFLAVRNDHSNSQPMIVGHANTASAIALLHCLQLR